MDFSTIASAEVKAAVTAALKGCNAVRADAASNLALGNSRTGIMMADAIHSEGVALVDRLLALYSEAEGLARQPKSKLQDIVVEAIRDFHRLTAQLGIEPEVFGGTRNVAYTGAHDRILGRLRQRADRYFAGYGAPKPQHWTVQRPVVWLIVQTAVTTVVAAAVSAITTNIISG